MNIDPTGILYALLHGECQPSAVIRDYFWACSLQFHPDRSGEIGIQTEHLDKFFSSNFSPGMGRLPDGFLYVLEDQSVVVGFDGDKLDTIAVDQSGCDQRIEHLLPWGDEPPPSSRKEFKRFCADADCG